MSEHPVDSRELLQRIAARKGNEEWTPLPPDDLTDSLPPMQTDAVVTALHDRWILPDRLSPGDAGRGWKRTILTPVGRLVFRVLAPYLRAERELLGQLVRSNDALARRCDELAARGRQARSPRGGEPAPPRGRPAPPGPGRPGSLSSARCSSICSPTDRPGSPCSPRRGAGAGNARGPSARLLPRSHASPRSMSSRPRGRRRSNGPTGSSSSTSSPPPIAGPTSAATRCSIEWMRCPNRPGTRSPGELRWPRPSRPACAIHGSGRPRWCRRSSPTSSWWPTSARSVRSRRPTKGRGARRWCSSRWRRCRGSRSCRCSVLRWPMSMPRCTSPRVNAPSSRAASSRVELSRCPSPGTTACCANPSPGCASGPATCWR